MTEPRRITCRRCQRLLFKSKEANGVVEAKCEKCGLIAEYDLVRASEVPEFPRSV